MQKVEGSNPFSRFPDTPLSSGVSSFWGQTRPFAPFATGARIDLSASQRLA
jgi:hypothetical protein